MTLPAIPLEQARRVARSGDLAKIRAMGAEHMARGASWERKSLERIRRAHGETGVIAALDADNPTQACLNLCQVSSGWYLTREGLAFWGGGAMESLWGQLCEGAGGYFSQAKLTSKECWDVVMMQPQITPGMAAAAKCAMDIRTLDPAALLWPGSNRSSVSWEAWKHALGMRFFVEQPQATRPDHQSTPLAALVRHAGLMARGRLGLLLDEIEHDPDLVQARTQARDSLAWAALQAANPELFRRLRQWSSAPLSLPGGGNMLEAGLLAGNDIPGVIDLTRRWRCLEQIGAKRHQVLAQHLGNPRFLEKLLSLVENGQSDYVVDVLTRAATAGVDLGKLRDAKGLPIVDAILKRNTMHTQRIASVVQELTLRRDTPTPPRAISRRRL